MTSGVTGAGMQFQAVQEISHVWRTVPPKLTALLGKRSIYLLVKTRKDLRDNPVV